MMTYSIPQPPHYTDEEAASYTSLTHFGNEHPINLNQVNAEELSKGVQTKYDFSADRVREFDAIDKYKVLFRGMRWLADNLLSWRSEGFTSPGDLDTRRIPEAKPQLESPK